MDVCFEGEIAGRYNRIKYFEKIEIWCGLGSETTSQKAIANISNRLNISISQRTLTGYKYSSFIKRKKE